MTRYTITFGDKHRREPHPFFGNCPTLPDSYGYVDADSRKQAMNLAYRAFGNDWSMLREGDAEAQDEDWAETYHQGLAFIIRPDTVGQPVITFPSDTPSTIDRTTIQEKP